MASYKIVPTPETEINASDVKRKLEEYSIGKSKKELKEGPLPKSLEDFGEGILYFEYGFEEEDCYETLMGEEKIEKKSKRLDTIPVSLLGSKFATLGTCVSNSEKEILKFLEKFVPGYSLEILTFNEKALRKFIDEAPDILKAEFDPKKVGKPEHVSAADRALRRTALWIDYSEEPISKIKVNLPGVEKKVRVGFDRYGNVIFYEKSVPLARQLRALKRIVDEVVSKYVRYGFQAKLGGDEGWPT